MIVVAIVSVLAVIALVGYNKYQRSAASGEARAMLLSIRGAEDSYKSEVLTYKTCGGDPSASASYYPRTLTQLSTGGAGGKKAAWDFPAHSDYNCWRELNVRSAGPVRYSFTVKGGGPGDMGTNPPPNPSQWPYVGGKIAKDPWFVAVAAGDYDSDGINSVLFTGSGQSEVTVVDDTE